jgi:TPR repeat protein
MIINNGICPMSDVHILHVRPWRAEALIGNKPVGQAFDDEGPCGAEWLEAATSCGMVEVQLRLGRMLLTGEGLSADRRAAFACFLNASAGGNAEAQNLLGRCYENGWGVASDRQAAGICYRLAAEKGDFRGAHNHACMLAAQGCIAGALHWLARGIGDAPEPLRQQMLKALAGHPHCAIRAFARRELESPLVARTD